jgi:hypothetical protein
MTLAMQHIIQHLFRVESLEEVPRERLEELVEEYPSFGIARYLLSRKLRAEQAGHFNEETQKTNLYFTNPLWLEWLLQNTAAPTPAIAGKPYRIATPPPASIAQEAIVEAPAPAEEAAKTEAIVPQEQESAVEPSEFTGQEALTDTPAPPAAVQDEEGSLASQPPASGLSAAELLLQSISEAHNLRRSLQEANDAFHAAWETPASGEPSTGVVGAALEQADESREDAAASNEPQSAAIAETPVEDEHASSVTGTYESQPATNLSLPEELPTVPEPSIAEVSTIEQEPSITPEPPLAEGSTLAPAPPIEQEPSLAHELPIIQESSIAQEHYMAQEPPIPQEQPIAEEPPIVLQEPSTAQELPILQESSIIPQEPSLAQEPPIAHEPEPAAPATPAVEPSTSGLSPAAPPYQAAGTAPANTEPPLIVFDSYHTIDYFASQGIKLTLDENPSDKLGKQLKSFTEWLKVMRKLPQKNLEAAVPDLATEHKIQSFAAHSIEGKEIVTETMAEVLAKQGMYGKAAEVYHKLSLLNPGKSAYFAGKIEQLKIE